MLCDLVYRSLYIVVYIYIGCMCPWAHLFVYFCTFVFHILYLYIFVLSCISTLMLCDLVYRSRSISIMWPGFSVRKKYFFLYLFILYLRIHPCIMCIHHMSCIRAKCIMAACNVVICMGHTTWSPEGRKRQSQEARKASKWDLGGSNF